MNERREKVLYIPEQYILSLILSAADANSCRVMALPDLPEIPADVQIKRIDFSWERRAFGLLLAHPSFDRVADGCFAPAIDNLAVKLTVLGTVDEAVASVKTLRDALDKIERWEDFPATGQEHSDGSPVAYGYCHGSNGERDFMRKVAREALNRTATDRLTNPPGANVPSTHIQVSFQNEHQPEEIRVVDTLVLSEGVNAPAWIQEVIQKHRDEMPLGWQWIVSDQTGPWFKPEACQADSAVVE